jgi:hypothetical protein
MLRALSLGLLLVLAASCGLHSRDADADNAAETAPKKKKKKPAAQDDGGSSNPSVNDDEPGAAGSGADDEDEPARELNYYAHTKPIIDAKCTPCHVSGGIGPMALTTYAEIKPFLPLIEVDVKNGVMPPWRANVPLNHFDGDRRLSDEQKTTMLDWIKQGAPEGEAEDEGEPLGDRVERALERVDIELKSPVGYKPQIEPDDYRCFVMEWPYEETKYVTGINIAPDVTSQVHHAIIYHVQPENAQSARDRDAADEGPGYTCFGATGGVSAWLQSYEPGGYAQGIPGNLGFEIKPGSVMILQVHYNTLNGIEEDQSKVEFTVEDSVPRVGKVVLIMNAFWPAGGMPIPANAPDVPFAYSGISASIAQDRDYGIYWVDLHMHRLGRSGRIGIIRADKPAELEVLLDIPKWDFKWQETYLLHEPNVLHPGDQLYVECHFDNTTDKQAVVKGERLPVRDVNWGDATTDEMCLGNVLVSPLP